MISLAASPVPPPSATLHLGGRDVVVEVTPLAKSRRTWLGIVDHQPRDNVLRIEFRSAFTMAAALSLAAILAGYLGVPLLDQIADEP
jgi:hypothetical protein